MNATKNNQEQKNPSQEVQQGFIFDNTPANIRQKPELNKQFIDLFKQTFGYKPSCSCSFFSDLNKLKEKLKSTSIINP